MKLKRIAKIIIFAFTVFAAVIVYNAIIIYRFSLQDETQTADCAIVAGAGIMGNRPSPVFQARLDHAVQLYRQGVVRALVLTGGYSPGAPTSDAAVARHYVLVKGVPADAVFIEERSTVTRENIRYARQILVEQQWRTALLVSDPLHMRRMKSIACDSGIDGKSSPTPFTRYRSRLSQARFLLSESLYYSGYRLWGLLPQEPGKHRDHRDAHNVKPNADPHHIGLLNKP
ncbi:YdcF family protein [Enterobacteriaceae bacterium BIT-l23]|uniref:YdcF family protein n=1 Tax=Jejubacter sp. L23 TaxID=3092086 RepID=UPI001584A3C9|nr:YdcF family protein [Enterobacteriaceae bacterium BIT-l23]